MDVFVISSPSTLHLQLLYWLLVTYYPYPLQYSLWILIFFVIRIWFRYWIKNYDNIFFILLFVLMLKFEGWNKIAQSWHFQNLSYKSLFTKTLTVTICSLSAGVGETISYSINKFLNKSHSHHKSNLFNLFNKTKLFKKNK